MENITTIDYLNSIEKDIIIKRSTRKSMSIEITKQCKIIVRTPHYVSESGIRNALLSKADWIKEKIAFVKEQTKDITWEKLSPEEITEIKEKAKKIIADKVEYYAKKIGVTYNNIKIKKQKTCWGSCSNRGNLNFNFLLALMPDNIINYVVIHELCHRLEMNHSRKFWLEVAKVMPDYEIHKNWLDLNGLKYMSKVFDE